MFTQQTEQEELALAPITGQLAGQGAAAKARNGIARFERDERGNVMIQFGMLASIMIGFIGLAVDFGRWVNARDQTVAAMDAAVIAGGRAMQTNGGDTTKALQVAQAYYTAAVKNRITTVNDSITFEVSTVANGLQVQAKGNAYIRAPFLVTSYNLIQSELGTNKTGNNLWPLLASGNPSKDASTALFASGTGGNKSLEMAMMLDVSGSMYGQKALDMQAAAKDLVDIVVWADQSKYTSKVAIVPFSGDVRLPQNLLNAVTAPNLAASYWDWPNSSNGSTWYATNCVVERAGDEKYSDAAPGPDRYVTRGYDRSQNNGVGRCSSQAGNEVLPMTNAKSDLKAKIDGLVVNGNTGGHIGTAWTYYMLSPKWAQVVGQASSAASYGDDKVRKIAVLMTDGEFNQVYRPVKQCRKSNGDAVPCTDSQVATTTTITTVGVDDSGSANDTLNAVDSPTQAKAICKKMKDDGIEVYTVGFDLGGNQTAINTLSNCATDASHFYNASTGEQLRQAFRDIAVKSTSIVLTQ